MTSRQILIQELEEKIAAKKRAIKVFENELESLNDLLEKVKDSSSINYDTLLSACDDFPLTGVNFIRLQEQIGSIKANNQIYATVNDLIHYSRAELFSLRQIGPTKVDKIEKWMKKNGLYFIS